MAGGAPSPTLPKSLMGNGDVRRWARGSGEDALSRLAAAVHGSGRRAWAAAAVSLLLLLVLAHPGARYVLGEHARALLGGRRRQLDNEVFKHSDSGGLCRLEYSVKTWDGSNALACDPSLCAGRERLKLLKKAGPERRWTSFHEATYMQLLRDNNIKGWLQPIQIEYVKRISARQHELGLFGAVGEIGVHHGKFLIPIVGSALAGEPAVAIDLFEDQAANVDVSGKGDTSFLLRNLELCGIPDGSIGLMAGNSMQLSARNFSARGLPAFRLLSVDGGHTMEVTLHDLMVASCVVRDGGVVVLDDWPNPSWSGVAEALMHFVHAQDRLVPFLHGWNKVWFTTASHLQLWRDFVREQPEVFKCASSHVSRQTIAGHPLCWTGPY